MFGRLGLANFGLRNCKGVSNPIPGLKGILGFYMGKGLTNEEMSKNPVWKDKSGLGNDLQMKNFAWGLRSGCGLYKTDFNSNRWVKSTQRADMSWTDNSINITSVKIPNIQLYYQSTSGENAFIVPSFIIKVTGLTDGQTLTYRAAGQPDILRTDKDGIYMLSEFEFAAKGSYYGFQLNKIQEQCNITIEQIPDYSGAIVFDGVDDRGVCETFPILTKEKGYTVMALRKWLSDNNNQCFASNRTGGDETYNAFNFELTVNNLKTTRSFSISSIRVSYPPLVSYQTSRDYNGTLLIPEFDTGNKTLLVGTLNSNSYFSNVAIYSLVIIDHDTTEEERQLVIDYWKKEYPELFFDQAWTVTGKTNEDSDRATIKNLTGNENNLALSNFLFAENSGYGLYQLDFSKWADMNDPTIPVRPIKTKSSVIFPSGLVLSNLPIYNKNYSKQTLNVTLKVSGAIDGLSFKRRFIREDGSIYEEYTPLIDGINKLEFDDIAVGDNWVISIGFLNRVNGNILENDIQIEQIPDYEGYLVTDGVDDKIYSSPLSWGEDWTMVGNWKRIENANKNSGIVAPNNLFVYIRTNGYTVYVRRTNSGTSIPANQMLAICSDGRIYDQDWMEYKVTPSINNNIIPIQIGFHSNEYCKMAFKNLAIYNRVLTKDQCIKAYDYLQTLKEK